MAATSTPDLAREEARLEALRRYAILDTPPEPQFDELVQRAARECGYSTSLITLMETNRCWFKATTSLASGDRHLRELPRDQTFCDHSIRSSGTFIVPDARQDERFRRLRIVDCPDGIRSYMGAPLITPDGHSIGTLSVVDTTPRTPTPPQIDALRALATRVMALLEIRHRDLAPAPSVSLTSPSRVESPIHIAPPTVATVPLLPLVLIVDDEELIRSVTAAMIGRLDCETRMAADGQEALERIAALGERVRLVITDIHMPVMNGVELVRALRGRPHAPVVIAMSGKFTPEIKRELHELGVTHLIAKPFGMAEIERTLEAVLAIRR